jgi:S-(hydroxymethyl)mycothiol dehydrogenase
VDRGVVLTEPGRFAVAELELGEPSPDDVLVRIDASGVCHTDLHVVRTGWSARLPCLLGHEGAGTVEAVGENVEHVRPGDPVVLGWRASCGMCRWCARGATHLCRKPPASSARPRLRSGDKLSGVMQLGTLATRTFAHADAVVPLKQGLSAEHACLVGCAIATGVCSVLKTAQVWEGARVAVIGCGAVGLSVVQGARIAGAEEIYAVDLDERKLDAALRFGATHTGEGSRLDFVFDVVGLPETVASGLRMLGHAGTLVYVGLPQPDAQASVGLQHLFDRRVRILVSHGGDHVPAEDFPTLMELASAGQLDLDSMITKRIALDDVEAAFEDMERGEVIRSVVVQ